MTSKKKTTSTPDAAPVSAPTADRMDPTKSYPPLDVRSTVLDPFGTHQTTNLALSSAVPNNTPNSITTNNSVDPTEAFKKFQQRH